MVCDTINDVESFGDIGDTVRDRICRTVCRMRRLTNETLRLFVDERATRLALYDCAGAYQRRLRTRTLWPKRAVRSPVLGTKGGRRTSVAVPCAV